MGVVYLARDVKLERPVAIKTLPPHLAGDPIIRERFLREARTAASLSHPSIVPIHRADEINGHVFFVMGLVDGPSLAQLLREGGPLTPRTAISILHDVADALSYAHAASVVHRDIKAENILVDRRTGRALVTDFGIARMAEAAPLTATGTVLGTVHYMSPEQVAGDAVDARSDLYSLGVVAFNALSGRYPFESPTASAVLVAHVTKRAPSLSDVAPTVPRPVAELVDRCLQKDPDSRWQSAAEFLAELQRAESQLPSTDVAAPRAVVQAVSATEAGAVWRRAAELQDMTGQLPAVDASEIEALRRGRREATGTSGYSVDNVRESAREAGIGTEFVERALVERGLAQGSGDARSDSTNTIVVRDGIAPPHNPILNGRTTIAFEATVPGEMPERDFEYLLETVRRALTEAGTVTVVGRSFSWMTSGGTRRIQVTVSARDGRTRIHVSERLKEFAGGVFGGIMGGVGGGSVGPVLGIAIGMLHAPVMVLPLMALSVTGSYLIARTVYGRTYKSRAMLLKDLTAALAEQARDSVARRSLSRGSPR